MWIRVGLDSIPAHNRSVAFGFDAIMDPMP